MERKLMMFFASLLLSVGTALAQTHVRGTVISGTDGEPVIGAAVKVVGTSVGVVTNIDGEFELTVPQGSKKLEVSYVGMNPTQADIKPEMKIVMKEDNQSLDEVLVVAYGTAKKSSFTGSAANISSEKIELRPISNVSKALEGQTTGVITTSGSGQPGAGASIVIRGFGSVNADNDPLYVVDGVPYDGALSSINPSDIEKITILKDASAGALYGSRGANGVVMITTKRGQEGKAKVSFRNSIGWSNRALPKYDLVSQDDFVQLSYEALRNSQLDNMSWEDASAYASRNLGGELGGAAGELYNPYKNYTWDNLIDPATGKLRADAKSAWNEDWTDAIMKKNALRHEHQLEVNGGSKTAQYMFSLSYLDEDGILKNTNFKRYTGRGGVDIQPREWFKGGLNVNLTYAETTNNDYDGTSSSNPWYTAQFMGPIYPVYTKDANGLDALNAEGQRYFDYGDQRVAAKGFNSAAGLYDDKFYSDRQSASVRTYLTFGTDSKDAGWLQGLKFSMNLGADYDDQTPTTVYNKYVGNQKDQGGLMRKQANKMMSYTFNQILNWNRTFNEVHNVSAMLGHEWYHYEYKHLEAIKTNIVPGIDELAPAANLSDATSYKDEEALESWFGRVSYNYADKYYLDASLRRDGSSRFYTDDRWGTFWSVGANWRLTNEEFMKDLTWLDNLSYKVSYGVQGNNKVGLYAWQSLFDLTYPNGSQIGAIASSLENKRVSWEKNGNFNTGIEANMFDNRLRLSVEYYYRKTTDMLLKRPMPLSSGFDGYYDNVGDMRNTGVEFSIGGTLIKNKDFVWNATFMGSTVSNKVLHLTDEAKQIVKGIRVVEEGKPIYTFYMPKTAGVDPATGKQLYWVYDKDADGNIINERISDDYTKASTSKYYFGSRIPDLYGSIVTDMTLLKNIDLSITTTYSIGGNVYDSKYASSMSNTYYGNNFHANALRRWQKPGDITDVPRIEVGGHNLSTNAYLIDASYFAIKNITLGYSLPRTWLKSVGLERARVYGSMDNVALFTHLDGMDPQYNLQGGTDYDYVSNKTLTFGLEINF